ncbi:hypothetical protein SMNI109538_18735 [Smaragdicoccus niigatensis]
MSYGTRQYLIASLNLTAALVAPTLAGFWLTFH